MPQVLKNPGFWIWHGCMYKGYVEFWSILIMAPYGSVMPKYASICLNVPQYAWTWLNIVECPWIGQKMPEELFWPKAQPESFQPRGGFVELGHFDKLFVKKKKKKRGHAGKNFGTFSPRYS